MRQCFLYEICVYFTYVDIYFDNLLILLASLLSRLVVSSYGLLGLFRRLFP